MSSLVSQLCFCTHNSVSLLDNLYYHLFVTFPHLPNMLPSLYAQILDIEHIQFPIFTTPQLVFHLLFDIPNINECIFFYFHY